MESTRGLSLAQKAALWEQWKQGLSLTEIARNLSKGPSSLFYELRSKGGFAPAPRCRSARSLQVSEREEISRGIAGSLSIRQMAASLGRPASTISREIARNGGRECYRASEADGRAWGRARRPQACRLTKAPRLKQWVARKLKRDWSPKQISVGLIRAFPDDAAMRVSHETVYQSLFVQARGVLKEELIGHLRRSSIMRRPRKASSKSRLPPSAFDGLSIRERPAEAQDRAVPGHWEGDLLMGGCSSQIATLVERRSRFVMLVKVDSKETGRVTDALAKKIRKLPAELRRSLTWDRGSEMAAHKEFTVATDVRVYFCDPHSPWQRGSNENTNGLLRQYFPKGEDVSRHSQAELNKIAQRLNERPRETLNWDTPAEALQATVASTG